MITFLLAHPERDTSAINILVSFRGKKYRRSTKESIPAKYWNQSKRRAKATRDFSLAVDINETLDKWRNTLQIFKPCFANIFSITCKNNNIT